ncbi:MAG: hypothetical protein GDA56_23845 [Hormoscilla sp. GM7CHS1pb]|nr:hypothetical protein [Hormoscilla sp. GM7CHS1pb]
MKKIIRTQAQAVLAIAFVAVWCVPVAQAQSGRPSRQADVTLSGESLRTIESRTTSSDYQRSFERSSQPGVEKLLNMLVGSDFHTRVAPAAF